MSIRSRLFSSVLPLALLSAAPALAEVRALLVGVSDYHHLDVDLLGPRNDVRLMTSALIARGANPQMVRILTTPGTELAEGLSPAIDPTRAAILAALDQLATDSGPGDTVVFYYSGHGSQAPDQSGDEPDGFDQILLPSDVKGWSGATGLVENAIIDDELQQRLQAILATGASLVGILDACHSATGFRDLGGEGVARYVSPALLGMPEALAEAAEGGSGAAALSGDFTFLYSSQQDQRSFEYPLGDRGNPDNWYGDFTRNLVEVLTSVPDLTWAQAVAAAADGLRQEQAKQTPDGEGPGLNAPVFGGAPARGRMRVEAGRLMQGMLSGLTEGAVVEIFSAAAGGDSLGRARLRKVSASDAELEFEGPLPATAYAELYAPGLPPKLRLALPEEAGGGPVERALLSILGDIRARDLAEGVDWSDEGYDQKLVMVDGQLVLVGRDGVVDPSGPGSSPRLAGGATPDVVLSFIDRAARVHRLNMALALAEGKKPKFGIAGAGLSVKAELLPASAKGAECQDPDGPGQALSDGASVSHCDQVWLTVSNTSKTAQDVTVLYVDRDLRILPIWPEQGLSNRLGFGASVEIGMRIEVDGQPIGAEDIIVIAVPARDGAPRTVLTGLAEAGSSRLGAAQAPVGTWLEAAMEDGQSRSFNPGARTDAIRVTRLRVKLTDG